MKKLLSIVLILSGIGTLSAQTGLLPIEKNGKWGLVNSDGQVVAEPVYDEAIGFRTYGIVRNTSPDAPLVALVDREGNYLLEPAPYRIRGCWQNASLRVNPWIVTHDSKEGLMDSLGNFLATPAYENIAPFDYQSTSIIQQNGKFGVIEITGKVWVEPTYSTSKLAWNAYLQQLLGDQANQIGTTKTSSEGLTAAYKGKVGVYNSTPYDKWGFVDTLGNTVVPFMYEDVWPFRSGVARVTKKEKNGFINREGKVIVPIEYEKATLWKDHIYAWNRGESKPRTSDRFDLAGNKLSTLAGTFIQIFPGEDDESDLIVISREGNGLFYASEGVGLLRAKDAKEILPLNKNYLAEAGEGLIRFTENCQSERKREGLGLCTVEQMGYVPHAVGCQYGVVDRAGTLIFPAEFDNIGDFVNGRAYAHKGGYLHVIDRTGNQRKTDILVPEAWRFHVNFQQNIGGVHPDQPFIMEGKLVFDGYQGDAPLAALFGNPDGISPVMRFRDDVYQVRLSEDQWGYVRFPERELVYWCGELPVEMGRWLR